MHVVISSFVYDVCCNMRGVSIVYDVCCNMSGVSIVQQDAGSCRNMQKEMILKPIQESY